MDFIEKMVERFLKLNRRMKRWQRVISVLSAVVVFSATYALVLPAITLDKETASSQAGIEAAAANDGAGASGTVYESEPEDPAEEEPEGPAANEPEGLAADEPEEMSGAEGGSEEADPKSEEAAEAEEAASEGGASDEASSKESGDDSAAESGNASAVPDAGAEGSEADADGEDADTPGDEEAAAGTAGTDGETALITDNTKLVYEDPEEEYVVYAEFGADAKLPVGVQLQVKEITKESDPEAYETYYAKALSEMQDKYEEYTALSFARFYDIAFVLEDKEVEPAGDVKVRIEYKEAFKIAQDTTVDTIHFDKEDEEKVDVIDTEIDSEKKGKEESVTVKAVEFESDKFSVYGVLGSETIETRYITADGKTYTITVTYGPDAEIPLGAELKAEEIAEDSEEYSGYLEKAEEALLQEFGEDGAGLISNARFFDVTILFEGEEIEPKEPVQVKIEYEDPFTVEEEGELKVVHFGKDGTEIIEIDSEEKEVKELVYDQNGFSVIGTIATTNQYGWPTANGRYVLVFQDGNNYYALAQDGSLKRVEYLNNTITFLGEGTTTLDYINEYLWYFTSSGTRRGYLSTGNEDPTLGSGTWINFNTDTGFSTTSRQMLSMSNGKIYGSKQTGPNQGENTTFSVSDGELSMVPLTDESASQIYYVPLSSFVADDNESEEFVVVDVEALIEQWKTEMTRELIVDKTAQVSDYANRIYKVDLMASSGFYEVSPSLALEFVVDASRSMYFPENIYQRGSYGGGDDVQGLRDWINTNGDRNTVYYTITQPNNAATNWAIYYNTNRNAWYITDASNHDAPDGNNTEGWDLNSWTRTWANDPLDGKVYVADAKVPGKPWCRLDYLKLAVSAASKVLFAVDPEAQIGIVAFNAGVNTYGPYTGDELGTDADTTDATLLGALSLISLSGGTNHALGLNTAYDEFHNEFENIEDCQSTCVLITDGAPNATGVTWTTIGEAADRIKDITNRFGQKTALYTLGLSLEHIGNNKQQLAGIATSSDHSFNAEKSTDVVDCITKIIQAVVIQANLKGDVTDVIDPAFYPVDSDGTPLSSGDWITLEGTKTTQGATDAAGQVTYSGGNWTVKWVDQQFDWPEMEQDGETIREHGWSGSLYVKSREDFLGGNTISTNTDRSFAEAKQFVDKTGAFIDLPEDDEERFKDFETPHVNVDNLSMNEFESTWTVYLGTEVDPSDELERFYEGIRISEVVSASDADHIRTADSKMISEAGFEAETFPLTDLTGTLTDEQWNTLITDGTLTIPYTAYSSSRYGDDNAGDIVITLTKEGTGSDYEKHATTQIGAPAEKYTLKVEYQPTDVNTEADYHTTPGGSPGDETDTITSENTHKINVFAKGLQITKTDEGFQRNLSDAEFILYRSARDDDPAESKVSLADKGVTTGQFVAAATLTIGTGGTAVLDPLEKLQEGEKYYLVETKAPDGYWLLTSAIETSLNITDSYVPKPDGQASSTKPATGIYDWTQTATIVLVPVGSIPGVQRTDENGTDISHAAIELDSENSIIYYKIANERGYELPNAGGPGTLLYTFGGIAMIAVSALMYGFRMRRRERGVL